MISFTVRMRFAPEDRAEIRSILQNLGSASRQEPGCVNYVAHSVETDPDVIVIYEQYRDAEALEAHRSSGHFDQYATNGLYRKMRERTLETLQEIV
ncbi:putative quinol monooxygenase [Terriglobus sp. ADX1]|uniref:putative quinol monooxygenase n=1 Tax=Terriglobus sp. ADX1 TaxID=2794063 RepID=UPI002FE5759D